MSLILSKDTDKKLTRHAKLLGISKKQYAENALKEAFARDNSAAKGTKNYEQRANKRSSLSKAQLANIKNSIQALKNKKVTVDVKKRLKAESKLVNA
jgi:hypothetical protein